MFAGVGWSAWAADPCAVCGKEIEAIVTTWEDKVAGVKQRLCGRCTELPDACYLCSLPLLRNYQTLPDGRTLCERDLRTVVLDDGEAAEIREKVKADLDRQFLRFILFEAMEEGKVRLSSGLAVVRCLVIREDEVEIHVAGSNERQTLRLEDR